jgi:hypothetical protein
MRGQRTMPCSSISRRIDRLGGDVGRIKHRLDLTEQPAT